MKQFIQAWVFVLAVVGMSAVHAAPLDELKDRPAKVLHADFTRWTVDSSLSVASDITGGSILINARTKQLTMTIDKKNSCPPHALCFVPPVVEYTLTYAVETDSCGAKVYSASRDLRAVDGVLISIKVRDNTQCGTISSMPFIPLADTEVILETAHFDHLSGEEVKTHSTFEGEALRKTLLEAL